MGLVLEHLAHVIDRDLHHLGMGGAELGGGALAVGLLREVVRVLLEVFVRRHNLRGGVDEHAAVIHVAALLLGHRGVGSVGAVAQRPDRVEGAGVEGVADLQLRNVAAGDRGDDQRVGLGQADGIVGIEAAAEVFLEQGIDGIDDAAGLAAREDDLAAADGDGVAFVAQRAVGADGKAELPRALPDLISSVAPVISLIQSWRSAAALVS